MVVPLNPWWISLQEAYVTSEDNLNGLSGVSWQKTTLQFCHVLLLTYSCSLDILTSAYFSKRYCALNCF